MLRVRDRGVEREVVVVVWLVGLLTSQQDSVSGGSGGPGQSEFRVKPRTQ